MFGNNSRCHTLRRPLRILQQNKDAVDFKHRLRLARSKGHNRVGVSFTSPEDGKRANFRNVVFSCYSEFIMMDKVHKPSSSVCYTASSDLFRFHSFSHPHIFNDVTTGRYCSVFQVPYTMILRNSYRIIPLILKVLSCIYGYDFSLTVTSHFVLLFYLPFVFEELQIHISHASFLMNNNAC
jgi:hypothetical protein